MAPKVTDFAQPYSVDEALTELNKEFSKWESAAGEGTRQLWSVLGRVYEFGSKIEANGVSKRDLIEHIKADPNVIDSPRWIAEKKSSHELLLVALLSLKPETKATKSQWFSAIRAAKKAEIPPDQAAFLSYIEKVGGIENARKSVAKPKRKQLTLVELVHEFEGLESDAPEFQAPDKFSQEGEVLPHGFGLVLVKGEKVGDAVVPIATITTPKLIERVMQKLHSDIEASNERQFKSWEAERHALAMKWRKKLKKSHTEYKKSVAGKRHPLEFGEFVPEQVGENEELMEIVKFDGSIVDHIIEGSFYRK